MVPLFSRTAAGPDLQARALCAFADVDHAVDQLFDALASPPALVLAGRGDRTCAVEGAEAMAKGLPDSEFVVFENSGHMTYVEENEKYLKVVRDFLNRHMV